MTIDHVSITRLVERWNDKGASLDGAPATVGEAVVASAMVCGCDQVKRIGGWGNPASH